jgi:hypothetical protein
MRHMVAENEHAAYMGYLLHLDSFESVLTEYYISAL